MTYNFQSTRFWESRLISTSQNVAGALSSLERMKLKLLYRLKKRRCFCGLLYRLHNLSPTAKIFYSIVFIMLRHLKQCESDWKVQNRIQSSLEHEHESIHA